MGAEAGVVVGAAHLDAWVLMARDLTDPKAHLARLMDRLGPLMAQGWPHLVWGAVACPHPGWMAAHHTKAAHMGLLSMAHLMDLLMVAHPGLMAVRPAHMVPLMVLHMVHLMDTLMGLLMDPHTDTHTMATHMDHLDPHMVLEFTLSTAIAHMVPHRGQMDHTAPTAHMDLVAHMVTQVPTAHHNTTTCKAHHEEVPHMGCRVGCRFCLVRYSYTACY